MNESGALAQLVGWSIVDAQLCKTFTFADFAGAMAFVNRLAALAEAANHHPDFRVAYNRVDVSLTTHDAGGLTQKDFALAAALDAL